MSRELLKQLKDKDPERRKAAIKGLARAKEKAAIVPLAKLAGDDPNAEVRDLAARAGRYILEQTGGLAQLERKDAAKSGAEKPAEAKPADKKGAVRFHVSDDDKQKAQSILNEAMNFQMRGDKARLMRALAKAIGYDPNLRSDAFFTSLVEAATGQTGDAAIALLDDKSLQEQATKSVQQARKQQAVDAHLAEIDTASWRDVGFDLAVYFVMVLVGVVIVNFVAIQAATRYLAFVEQRNTVEWPSRVCADEDGELVCRRALTPEQVADGAEQEDAPIIAPVNLEAGFRQALEDIRDTPIVTILLRGGLGGLGAALQVLLLGAVIHGAAALLLRGSGRLPYSLHRIAGLLTSRTATLLVISGVGLLLVLSGNGLTIGTIFLGIGGLISVATVFALFGLVGKAYDFGLVKGIIASVIGLAVVGALASGISLAVL